MAIQAVKLDDQTTIYIEVKEPIEMEEEEKAPQQTYRGGEFSRGDFGGLAKNAPRSIATPKFPTIEETIQSYTNVALTALKNISSANVDKVTLEFGIKIGGKAGIPFVTEGTAESNLKVTVECSFPKELDRK